MSGKRILIIAGPNGAGKTTFANVFLPNEADCPIFVNGDLIEGDLQTDPKVTLWIKQRAARAALKQIRLLSECDATFAFETTLAGRSYIHMIQKWRIQGYSVKLIFLSLRTPEQAIARVAERVKQGGHYVPEDTIRRRFDRGLENFHTIYRNEVSFWQLYDNSGEYPILLEESQNK